MLLSGLSRDASLRDEMKSDAREKRPGNRPVLTATNENE
jgi:hypothetical protein